MANVEKISIALTPEMADLLRGAVESGEYASSSEVVREALREWKQRRLLRQSEIEELRRLWAEGLASGPGHFAHIDEIKAEGRRRRGEGHLAMPCILFTETLSPGYRNPTKSGQ